jgi:hypothetical protein
MAGCVGCQPVSTQQPSAIRSSTPTSPRSNATSTPATVGQAEVFAVFVKDFYVGATGYQIQLVGADGRIAHSTTARNRGFKGGLLDLPVTSTTSSRVYYLDGDSDIRYLAATGQIGTAYHIAMTPKQLAGFAVTPDDRRIAVTLIDYAKEPSRMSLFIDDLAGGHRVEIFSSSTVYEWPVGWHQGHLVLAVSPIAFVQNAGDWFMGSRGFHIIDPASGNRLETICEDIQGNTPFPTSPWGGICLIYPKVASVVSWDGVKRELLVGDQCRTAGPPSPDGSQVAVLGRNRVCGGAANDPLRLIDSRGRVAASRAVGNPLGWLDNLHLIFQEDLPPFSPASATAPIKFLDVADSSVVVVNASGFFVGTLPGGLG